MTKQYFNTLSGGLCAALLIFSCVAVTVAQTTQFSYQGLLNDGGSPANGSYDLQFRLFDAAVGGTQIGSTVLSDDVTVSNGLFKVTLDFGAAAFPGADRWLEIGVRPGASSGTFTTLAPRQKLTATPYALRSLSAANADTATNATNATNAANAMNAAQLGGVAASQYVLTSDARLADARPPTPGSANYIQNTTSQQSGSNFNISGNGTAGGTFSANVVTATQYTISVSPVLRMPGSGNLFVGAWAGESSTGSYNTFLGAGVGQGNTGGANVFVGFATGGPNSSGGSNAFFGAYAGSANTTGNNNSFFGRSAGFTNTTASNNSFFGYGAGASTNTGNWNSFFGASAGQSNTTGTSNAFFGYLAGYANTTGVDNSFFGRSAGQATTTGFQNAFFGSGAGESNTSGTYNAFFGRAAGYANTTGGSNVFVGEASGFNNSVGFNNTFLGTQAGQGNSTGAENTFLGIAAALNNTTGTGNTAVGSGAGWSNTVENNNTFLGRLSNGAPGISNATAIGAGAVVTASNTVVLGRSGGQDAVNVPGSLTVMGTLTATLPGGSGNYIQNMTSPQASSNFNISGNGTIGNNLTVNGTFLDLAGSIRKGGTLFLHNLGSDNTAMGMAALDSNTTGYQNAAFGVCALCDNTSGARNVAVGRYALTSNVSGQENVAVGGDALFANNGDGNIGIGSQALNTNGSGGLNVAVGTRALYNTANTQRSVAVGAGALFFSNGGNDNIGIGYESGKWLGSGSNNIMIGNGGDNADANTIRIGGSQTATYIAGIRDANAGGNTVYVDANGRLSSLTSSRRTKQDIRNLGGTTETLMALRPVRYRYRALGSEGPEFYGLIAEEVFEVAPELVGRDKDGQIDSVAYDKINILLLNEVQQQQRVIEAQKGQLRQLELRLKNLENRQSRRREGRPACRQPQQRIQRRTSAEQKTQREIESLKKRVGLPPPQAAPCPSIKQQP